ncbi:Uncharacterised protein [Bordetella ansorpii]|uniref:Uncharacterized protein n=1 Tax=Bordetella ansorpii TaxID=288768 RepID=A0A157Q5J6_9BORD|nr:hypothetical protein [Bordetella ansorpii]SAI41173.1 Uncharacterised protein [Bordetella ansorpii]
MEVLGYIMIGLAMVYVIVAIYGQSALSELLDYFRDRPELLDQTGYISDLYFVFDMSRCRYGFVNYIYRHPVPPPQIAEAFPDYARLRKISNGIRAFHMGIGIYAVTAFVVTRLAG